MVAEDHHLQVIAVVVIVGAVGVEVDMELPAIQIIEVLAKYI